MMILYITCNPYLKKPFPQIAIDWGDGNKKPLSPESSLARVEMEDLHKSLTRHGDWEGLFPMIAYTLGISEITIVFRGSYEDYCDLQETYDLYAASHLFSVKFEVDEELAKNVSPVWRRQFLYFWFKRWKEISWKSRLDDMWKACGDYLASDSISPAESVVRSKDIMERYLWEYLPEEEKEWDGELKKLYKSLEGYEIKLQVSTEQAKTRLEQLRDLLAGFPETIKKLESMMNDAMENVEPPQSSKLVEMEINGEMGSWVEEEDAFIFIERFRAKALSYYRTIQEQWIEIWKNQLQELERNGNDEGTDQCVSNCLQEFSACVPGDDPVLEVPLSECREESVVPSYWGQDAFRKSVRNYIDVFAYENDLLVSIRTQLNGEGECWRKKLFRILEIWNGYLTDYSSIIQQILVLEERKHYVSGIRKIAEGLISIDRPLLETEE